MTTMTRSRQILLMLAAMLLTTSGICAQTTQAKKPTVLKRMGRAIVRPWQFQKRETQQLWLAMAPLAVGLWLDASSTSLVRLRRPDTFEKNWFLPAHPTDRQLAGLSTGYFVLQLYVTDQLRQRSRDWVRSHPEVQGGRRWVINHGLWRFYPLAVGGLHGAAASSNYNLITCPSGYKLPVGQIVGCVPQ